MKLTLAVLALSASSLEPTYAATMKAEYFGQIYSGADVSGYFGLPGQALSAKSITISYVYDTVGGIHVDNVPVYDEVYGYSNANPMISAAVTINDVTKTIYDNSYGHVVVYGQPSYNGAVHEANEASTIGNVYAVKNVYAYLLGFPDSGVEANIEQPFSIALGRVGNGHFEFYEENRENGSVQWAYGWFTPTALTVTRLDSPAPVPLPSSGGLLLASSLIPLLFSWQRRKAAGKS